MKASAILGLNARYQVLSYKYNKPRGKRIATSKLLTKKVLEYYGIPVPIVYKKFFRPQNILNFDWSELPNSFALKPSKGLGGEGIIVIKKRSKDGDGWITTSRNKVSVEDLKLHTLDILEGAYSLRNTPDVAFVEEYVGRHKAFRKYAYRGTPDIRIIVFNKVPIMAMLRLPTKDSGGRANLHQGALGVGVDIATGITTHAIWYGKLITHKPGTKRKLHGIKIPNWSRVLEIAVLCSEASKLGFLGVDVVLHPSKGPMVLEINYQPGFQIQLANLAGLRKRLDRVEDLNVRDAKHGVNIARALFASSFAHRVRDEKDVRTISALEDVTVRGAKKDVRKKVKAKIDTGAWRTSLEYSLAEELGLLNKDNIFLTRKVKSSLGLEDRPIIGVTFWLAGKKIKTYASVAKRERLRYSLIVGRRDLAGFLVDPYIESHDKEAEDRAIKKGEKKLERYYGKKL
jgi:alpha-L-glutamate ligase-like protein